MAKKSYRSEDLTYFNNIYSRRRVLVTGHTGFKGSWLCLWLTRLNAHVIGYSLPPPTKPNHFEFLHLPIISITGDIRDREFLFKTFQEYQPEVVFHLAAQALVRRSYLDPVGTYETNVLGTLNVLEACRKTGSVKAIVNVTSDKCYENREWAWGYREIDPMGGHDPYSSSKGCSELLTSSYRLSYFHPSDYGKRHGTLLASARAGNVIGGGDWAADRLVPDIMKATFKGEKALIRFPLSVRPWQHVLEPISGYLLLGQRLLEGKKEFADAWNFGPYEKDCRNVITLARKIQGIWEKIDFSMDEPDPTLHEAIFLRLDCSKARTIMEWEPIWDFDIATAMTARWYRAFYEDHEILSEDDLNEYLEEAFQRKAIWTNCHE